MAKFQINEELLSIIKAIAKVFPFTIEVEWNGDDDDVMDLKSVAIIGRNPGYSRDLIFRFLEISSDGYGEAQIFVRRANGKEEDVNTYIKFSDPQEFKEAVERLYERGPNGLDWYHYRFGESKTNSWTDDVFDIIPC